MLRRWTDLRRALYPALDKLGPAAVESLLDQEAARRLYCVACRAPVSDEDQRIEVDGAHVHRFENPDGLRFLIGCFADAPGCAPMGPPTLEWTWFAGHAWQVASCRACGAHLGWRYRDGDGGGFYGLILDRLVTASGGV
jgi:hypothetical protein